MITIRVMYTCALCGTIDRGVDVPARMDPDAVDVKHWVEQIMGRAISDDHSRHSPFCPSRKMDNVKIPITNVAHIGGPAVQ